jgi:DNA transposition AAA+ family ATPase
MNEQDQSIMDSLLQQQRIRGETRMFLEGTAPELITDEKVDLVIHHVELYAKEKRISRKDIGRDLGYSPSVISEVLSKRYPGDWKQVILDLDTWLDEQRKRDDSPLAPTVFVDTEVAREIFTVANMVISTRKIGMIYGPDSSGIGKTMALRAIQKEKPGSLLVTCDKIEANPTGLLRAIATELQITPAQNNRALYARIKDILRGTSRLLIVDQIHNLRKAKDDKPFYILTDLWDAAGSPQLWSGTADLVSYLNKGRRQDESLAQIRRRLAFVRDLLQRTRSTGDGGKGEPLFSIASIRKMFGSNKIRLTPDAERFIMQLANIPDSGALGTVTNLVQLATLIATNEKKSTIDTTMLLGCLQFTVQADVYQHLVSQVKLETRQPRMVAAG